MMNQTDRSFRDGRFGRLKNEARIGLSLIFLIVLLCQSAFSQDRKNTRLECKSEDFRRAVCSVEGPIERLLLVEKKSKAPCVEGSSFGFSGKSVWVDKGCVAQFEVTYRSETYDPSYGAQGQVQSLRCASENFGRTNCNVDGRVRSVALVRQRSRARCEEGISYGYRDNFIWVDKGCDAEFEVRFASRSASGLASRNKKTRFICKSSNHRLGVCYVAGSIVDLRLLDTRSRASCVKNNSYGFRRDVLWVKDGCEGDFEVTYRPDASSGWEFTNSGPQKLSLTCKSDQFREGRCDVGGVISEIRLTKTRSRASCTAGSTFGFDFNEIWVTKGCEGEFEVLYFPRP